MAIHDAGRVNCLQGRVDTSNLRLHWEEAYWDSMIYGYPVLQITKLEVLGDDADCDMRQFEMSIKQVGAGIVSCRLPHDRLVESMFLEAHGFRFVEMVYQPQYDYLQMNAEISNDVLSVTVATADNLSRLIDIAGSAFINERFHVDPRLDPALGDERYRRWVQSSLHHPRQCLQAVSDGDMIVAFFITEMLDDGTYYWHLNAIAPEVQGRGYGKRAWRTMLLRGREMNATCVRTSIVARNHRVLNLYSQLGFRFPPPQMTFHWVSGKWS